MRLSGIIFLWVLLTLTPAFAQDSTSSKAEASAVVSLKEDFSVFPANQFGNTIYQKGKKIVSKDDLNLRDIIEAPKGFVYYGRSNSDEAVVGYTGEAESVVSHIGGPYYLLKVIKVGTKLFRIKDDRLQGILNRSKTAGGLVYNGQNAAAFTHIAKGEAVEVDGKSLYRYSFKVHVLKDDAENSKTLAGLYTSYNPSLGLKWVGRTQLKIPSNDGQGKTVTIK